MFKALQDKLYNTNHIFPQKNYWKIDHFLDSGGEEGKCPLFEGGGNTRGPNNHEEAGIACNNFTNLPIIHKTLWS